MTPKLCAKGRRLGRAQLAASGPALRRARGCRQTELWIRLFSGDAPDGMKRHYAQPPCCSPLLAQPPPLTLAMAKKSLSPEHQAGRQRWPATGRVLGNSPNHLLAPSAAQKPYEIFTFAVCWWKACCWTLHYSVAPCDWESSDDNREVVL